jgi:hypothetical protein
MSNKGYVKLNTFFIRNISKLALIFISLFITGTSMSYGQEGKSQRVLFLGNSVFYYQGGLYQSFEGFCNASGHHYQAISQRKAPANTHGIEFLGYGRIPLSLPEVAADQRIHALIRSGNFDYVVLEARRVGYLLPAWVKLPEEGQYGEAIPYEENQAALAGIHRTIVESGAKTVLYMHPGDYRLTDIKHAVAQIYWRFQADLERMEINGRKHEVILVPASLLWLDAVERYGLERWYADPLHGRPMARYASGCMVFTYLTGQDPRSLKFNEVPRDWNTSPGLPARQLQEVDARWIKEKVWLYFTTRPRSCTDVGMQSE